MQLFRMTRCRYVWGAAFLVAACFVVAPRGALGDTISEGSLIRATGDIDVYVVKIVNAKKFKRHIVNPQVFNLYKSFSWANIIEVSPTTLAQYQTSNLARLNNDPRVFTLSEKNYTPKAKRWIPTPSDFSALNYDWDAVYTVKAAELNLYPTGPDLTGASQAPGQHINVALSASTPPSQMILAGATFIPLSILSVTNPLDTPVNVTALTVTRGGLSSDASVDGVLITDSDNVLHGSMTAFRDNTATSVFADDPITIAAKSSTDIGIRLNIRDDISEQSIMTSIVTPNDIVASTEAGEPVAVEGIFPLAGNTMNILSANYFLGELVVSAQPVLDSLNQSLRLIRYGTYDANLAKFRFKETSNNESIELTSVRIRYQGTASAADITHLRLISPEGRVIASEAAIPPNNELQFHIQVPTGDPHHGRNGGYIIQQGRYSDILLSANIAVDKNLTGTSSSFIISSQADIRTVGLYSFTGTRIDGNFPLGLSTNIIRFY